ncbi:hypothetical protein R1sor_007032 [Riccia sorocarpa]|uniref:Uncharacterized protein n=1 Tax=Riccia sorocarpa TaxID=122646 RepID=A0ABD3HRH6_9MARC
MRRMACQIFSWQAMRRMGWHLLASNGFFLPPHATHGVAPSGKPCAAWLARFFSCHPIRRMGWHLLASHAPHGLASEDCWQAMRRMGCHQSSRISLWHPMCRMACQQSSETISVTPHAPHGLGILKPPQGSKAQDMLPHNKEWDIYKAREEARLKAQVSTQRDDLPEEDVEEDPASKIVSPEVDRAKKKRNDGSSQRVLFSPFRNHLQVPGARGLQYCLQATQQPLNVQILKAFQNTWFQKILMLKKHSPEEKNLSR